MHSSLYRASLWNFIILMRISNIWNILGPAYDLTICEVRNTSLVLLWKAPVYEGKSPITGYLVDYKEVDTEDWVTANEKPTSKRYLKVTFSLVLIQNWVLKISDSVQQRCVFKLWLLLTSSYKQTKQFSLVFKLPFGSLSCSRSLIYTRVIPMFSKFVQWMMLG